MGCALAGIGAAITAVLAAPRAEFSFDGGFENHARDLGVVFVELPLIVLGGALVPLFAWMLTKRWVHQPWLAVIAAVLTLSLGILGVLEWWTPRQHPDPGYGPGS
ncbi:hypothetical protein FH609_017025 [Streptomyces sp. 3MP-14]|uniref:Uncharacterized protein n=2 Tax=Streptomyces TaxID=1883 RepID=A0A5N6ACW4_9ACTN|nr:hypothetical protein FH607_014350 [Streptomyces mimosae]KAB8175991.1 hypothetical protein FH609_017025 [Streptomyces sp. 3MP-14]